MRTDHATTAFGAEWASALSAVSRYGAGAVSQFGPTRPGIDGLVGEPLLYPLVAAIGFIALYGLYRLVRRLRRPAGVVFRHLLEEYDAITILLHPNPDPDAMASAMAVKTIAERTGTDAKIQYSGQIRRPENRAFRTVLGFECDRIEAASDIAHPEGIVLVDHNTARGFVDSERIEPIAVIDHHPGNGTGDEFTDVREEYGAAASILTEYLSDLDAVFEPSKGGDEETFVVDCQLATGLTYGIQSDTKNLTRGCTKHDFAICATLFPAIDEDLLHRIATPEISHDVLRVKATAINNVRVEGSFGICNVGEVGTVDALSQAVEELMRLEGTTAVVIYGVNNGTVHVSARSKDDRVHMGEALQRTVSHIETASAGGHARMAGGQIPVSQMETGESSEPDFETFDERLLQAMNGDY
ncbi:MAG: DHH family phosphoesterase [Halobacteriota archaeon]|uniref:DHH family phosphoesterase n=1 Tax=Natronomonas sp. TaxID=2184060 RepID=UPI00397642B1